MPWGWGRGFRWWYYATGMPGWMRAGYGLPVCRWFPWLPRWWWTGIYGPVQWTPQGPVLATQQFSTQLQMSKDQEVQYLEEEIKALEEEKKAIEQELEAIRKRLEELRKQNKE